MAMARLLAVSVLIPILLSGCVVVDLGHDRESRSDRADVRVDDNSADVRVRPGTDDGNVDVHVAWP